MSGVTLTGSSGRNYAYLIFDPTNERHMLQGAANYAFAANDRLPIFIAATDNLKRSFLKDKNGGVKKQNLRRALSHGG